MKMRLLSIKSIYIGVLMITAVWILGAFLYSLGVCNDEDLVQKLDDLKKMEVKLKMYNDHGKSKVDSSSPWIFAITPTYARPVQKAELTRLCQTFLHVTNFHWIIVEDSSVKTLLVTKFMKKCGLKYTHLNVATPPEYKMKANDPNWLKPRGVLQRNLALKWLRDNVSRKGVVYFADDDNTYDLKVFEEMRSTNKVSVWPVGLVGGLRFERPRVENGRVVGWYTFWKPNRPFAMDMAGFAINIRLVKMNPDAKFDLEVPRGYQESSFLTKIVTMDELEPKARNCTEILVWHTRTEAAKLKNELRLSKMGKRQSDLTIEV